jgi:hypothetical protein
MRRQIIKRLRAWKEIFWGKAFLIGGTLWAILGAWDLFKSEILPEKYQSWTLVAKTPHLSLSTWVIVLLAILLAVLLEGAHAAIQKRDDANLRLQCELKEAAYGKTTKNRDWPGDWKLAEDGFRRYEKSLVRADWFRDSSGPTEQWRVCGGTLDANRDCEAFCLQAGRLLVVSPVSSHISAELRSRESDADRWLYFLKERYGLQDVMHGTSKDYDGRTSVSEAGSIRNLAVVSARACVECGAKSF